MSNSNCSMGHRSYGSIKVIGQNGGKVFVGRYTSIADNVKVITLGHNLKNVTTFPFNAKLFNDFYPNSKKITSHPIRYGDTLIGCDVWIGYDVTIIGGNSIGHGAVVAAETCVTRHVLPYEVVAGNPMKRIKMRFNHSQIEELLKIRWWIWNDEKVNEEIDFLMSDNIDKFIERNRTE